ncbi:fumarylacetoacetate hydrolase [Ilyonectria robusta]|uniref:fumarylacetoacetate hydrolase n=1 Tax=Ilyonectria robusta TaxID=1079257 RepID=UPI001E8E3F2F|nr:fumarylacetoacetate hydrolase [Ilyonectria robusta]KAH8680155.1 fumarylacetoacetate hydrolase [Ilyonectria robusta]
MSTTNQRDWTHLVRFVAAEDGLVYFGQVDAEKYPDVGLAALEGKPIPVNVVAGSQFDGIVTSQFLHVSRLLSPVPASSVPIILCMGLNYRDHAIEIKMPIPESPILFIKPRNAISGPYPEPICIPAVAQDGTSDYEAEMAIVISKTGKNIAENDAMDYVLGFTCANDVSARKLQFANSQWCFSKGFDGSAPIGPVLVSPAPISDPQKLAITASLNSEIVQDSNTSEMIFQVSSIVSYLSQGTTLEQGTVILTGTGPGVGAMRDPVLSLKDGDDMRVYIEKIGTLVNKVSYE